jgi:hypothetical protein
MARELNGLSEESTEQVIKFPPKQQSSISADEAGQAVIAKIRKAAELSHETCDRAMALAHKLAMELRAAEDRITFQSKQLGNYAPSRCLKSWRRASEARPRAGRPVAPAQHCAAFASDQRGCAPIQAEAEAH